MGKEILKRALEYENYLVLLIIPVFLFILTNLVKGDTGYWTQFWWMFPIAVVIATVVNTVGISGAALFVPFFAIVFPLLAFGLTPGQSVMLGLITESFGISSSTMAFMRFGLVDTKIAFRSLTWAIPVVIISSVASFYFPEKMIYFLISLALFLSVYSLGHSERIKAFADELASKKTLAVTHQHRATPENVTLTDRNGKIYNYCRCAYRIRLFGYSLGGIFQGISGFGIGEMGVVSMIVSGIPAKVGVGTNHIIVAGTAIVASATHLLRASATGSVETPWNIIAMTVPAVIIGGQIAPYVAARLNTILLEKVLSVIFVILAIALIYIGIR